jgi:hypothetical protein
MSNIIETKIDGVPVKLKLLDVGPTSLQEVNELLKNLKEESVASKVKLIQVGDENTPATREDVELVEQVLKDKPTELILNLLDGLSTIEKGKQWWQSRTIWVNIIAILASLGATVGLKVDIDPEFAMTVYPAILAIVNLILRARTETSIQKPKSMIKLKK